MSRNESDTQFRDRPSVGYRRHRIVPMRVCVLLIAGIGLILLAHTAYNMASKALKIDSRSEQASISTYLSVSTLYSVLPRYPVECRRLCNSTTRQSLQTISAIDHLQNRRA